MPDAREDKPADSLVTIECGRPGDAYTLFQHGNVLDVHLARPGEYGGTGPCLCGFNRHKAKVGFAVGGGVTGPNVLHEICRECADLANGREITGLHKKLFAGVPT